MSDRGWIHFYLSDWTSEIGNDFWQEKTCFEQFLFWWWLCERTSFLLRTLLMSLYVRTKSCAAVVPILSWTLSVALEISETWMVRSEFLHISETSVHAHGVARHPGFKTGEGRCGWPLGNETLILVYQGWQLTEVCWQIKGIRQTNVCERASLI